MSEPMPSTGAVGYLRAVTHNLYRLWWRMEPPTEVEPFSVDEYDPETRQSKETEK